MTDTAPLVKTLSTDLGPTAAASDTNQPVGEAPFAGTVTAVTYTPRSTLTGANTESRTLSVVNKGAGGSGTTVVATLAFVSGVNATGSDEKAITLSVVAGATTVAAGDILQVTSTHVGSTGLADPGGLVQVEITRG